MDNIVDVLKIEVEGETKQAVNGIDNLIGTLGKIKAVTEDSNKGLFKITKTLDKLDATLSKFDLGNSTKLKGLVDGLQGLSVFSDLKLPTKIAERIVDIGEAVDCLKGVDFSKLQEMANGLTALQGLHNANVPHFDNTSSSSTTSSASTLSLSDSSIFDAEAISISPAIEETRLTLSQLSNDLDKSRSLWTDLGKIGRSALQKIDTALTPLKPKIAGVAATGIIQFNIWKQKAQDTASDISSKLSRAFEAVKSRLQPVGNAMRYIWNTITQPIQGVISIIGRIGGTFGEILQKAKVALSPIGKLAEKVFGKLGSFATKGTAEVAKAFGKLALLPLKNFKDSMKGAIGKVGEFFTMFKKRALYRAINGIISAITTGFKEGTANVYQYSKAIGGTLSSSLDSISTSFLYFKNSIGAAVAPLINMLAPAIEYIIDKCVALLNVLNQVFAKLSGASSWTKAVKYPTEYAKAADSAKSANEKLKKSILGIDEINPLSDNSSKQNGNSGKDLDYSAMFEEVDIGEIDNPFTDFFAPFKEAWENEGQNTIDSIKTAFAKLKDMFRSIGESFEKVWTNGTGQQTIETILGIVQNIVTCVGNLASSFQKAWDNAETGTKIVQGVWDVFNDLLNFIEGIYGITADWLGSLDLSPLLTSVSGVISAFEPLVGLIGDTLLQLYETVLLPIAKWAIEEAAPASIDAITSALEMLHAFLEPFLAGFQNLWNSLQPIVEWVESVVIVIINGIRSVFEKCAKVFEEKGEKIQEIFSGIGDIISVVWVVVEPIFNTLKDVVGNVFSFIGDIVSTNIGFVIDLLHGLVDFVAGVFTGDWDRAWNGIKGIFVGIWDGIKGIALGIWDFLKGLWDSIKNNIESVWNGIAMFMSNQWNGIKKAASDIWNAMWNTIKKVINSILGGVEKMVNGVIKGFNLMINALNKLSFDVPDWVPAIGGKKFGFNIKNISEVSLPRLANGGIVNAGQMFIAREAGPELVGSVGNKSAVMNNDQIVAAVSSGVASANEEQNRLLREQNSLLRMLLSKDTTLEISAASIVSALNRKTVRDGV